MAKAIRLCTEQRYQVGAEDAHEGHRLYLSGRYQKGNGPCCLHKQKPHLQTQTLSSMELTPTQSFMWFPQQSPKF